MPRRARARRRTGDALSTLQARLDRATGDSSCVAILALPVGILMRCARPCEKCKALEAELAAYREGHPLPPPPKPTPRSAPTLEEDSDL
jgi:hypothetical protein